MLDASVTGLIDSLFEAFASSGTRKAVLPPDRRELVVELLTRLMASPDLFEAYTAELKARRERLGPAVKLRLLGMAAPDIPGDDILRHGFDGLPDDNLADLAISPEALEALDEVNFLGEEPPGLWFFDAIRRENDARPDASERAERAKKIFAAFEKTSNLEVPQKNTHSYLRERRKRAQFRWISYTISGSLAASLLIGVGAIIGGLLFRGTGLISTTRPMEVLVASVTPQFATARGNERDLHIQTQSGRSGFATVISLAPDRKQLVFPEPGSEDIRLVESVSAALGPIPPETKTTLVVITETRSTDAIRRWLLEKDFRADDVMRLQSDLYKTLSERGYVWASVGITRIGQSAKP